ncbi:MAG: Rpn family recombination-promoting nuclease/putative transposase [Clostridiales bacterium]|nr:Rpn family recombination-promoting nuclease/putative transposase [Clostridiales bacterium]
METLTEAAKNAYTNELNKKYDEQLKKTLSIKIFLANILKDCLEEFKDYDQYDIAEKYIEGEPEVSVEAVHINDKEVITGMDRDDTVVRYDILFYAYVPSLSGTVKLIINIEAQNKFNTKYPLLKRAVYYCSRLISDQYNKEFTNSEYGNIKKVVSIWICWDAPKNKQNTITRFSLKEQNIIGKAKYNFKDYDLLDIVMVCLGKRDSENYKSCLKLIDVITASDLSAQERLDIMENDFNIKITKNIEEGVTTMCNVSYGIEKRGEERGEMKGRAEGRAEGIIENLTNNIKALMETGQYTFDSAFNILKAPEDKYSLIKKMVLGM